MLVDEGTLDVIPDFCFPTGVYVTPIYYEPNLPYYEQEEMF